MVKSYEYSQFNRSSLCLGEQPLPSSAPTKRPVSANVFADTAKQNSGNMMTGRSTTRVVQPPGGASSICLGHESEPLQPMACKQASGYERGDERQRETNGTGRRSGGDRLDSSCGADLPGPPGGRQGSREAAVKALQASDWARPGSASGRCEDASGRQGCGRAAPALEALQASDWARPGSASGRCEEASAGHAPDRYRLAAENDAGVSNRGYPGGAAPCDRSVPAKLHQQHAALCNAGRRRRAFPEHSGWGFVG